MTEKQITRVDKIKKYRKLWRMSCLLTQRQNESKNTIQTKRSKGEWACQLYFYEHIHKTQNTNTHSSSQLLCFFLHYHNSLRSPHSRVSIRILTRTKITTKSSHKTSKPRQLNTRPCEERTSKRRGKKEGKISEAWERSLMLCWEGDT